MTEVKYRGGVGFRGFNDFNKALLSKHCWRLMSKEGSLKEKIFKTKYYTGALLWRQNCSFNLAMLGEESFVPRNLSNGVPFRTKHFEPKLKGTVIRMLV